MLKVSPDELWIEMIATEGYIRISSVPDSADIHPDQEVLLKSIQFSVNSVSLLSEKVRDILSDEFISQYLS